VKSSFIEALGLIYYIPFTLSPNFLLQLKSAALKMHAEDMSTLLTQHALQAADAREEHNDTKQLQLDQTDNIDGE